MDVCVIITDWLKTYYLLKKKIKLKGGIQILKEQITLYGHVHIQ